MSKAEEKAITPDVLERAGFKGEMWYKINDRFKYHIGQKVITLTHKGHNLIVMEILSVPQLKVFLELIGMKENADRI